ncbi:Zinc finger protein 510 [Eumeta japonica]|uniref:Zinc finger protein 510 n=1 Tax=Eumeta variegata TaxID=151549 RepID=A0A4C1VUF9_EUMVA|nr:Zinc finger protein 510 [Eumeta japonica]
MSRKDLLYHVLTVEEEDVVRYMCTKCDKLFAKMESCLFHLKNKHFRGPFACPLCDDTLVNKTYKAQHLALKHGKEELETEQGTVLVDCRNAFRCGICEKTFSLECSLRSHLRFHKRKQCQHCGLTLDTVPEMTNHLHEVHGEAIPTCGVCGYKSRKKNDVVSHQRKVHMKEKTVKCEVCDEKFFNRPQMLNHMVKHNPEKKFECEFCHKKYPRLNTLNEHRKIHKGIKNKVCQICGERFVQKASLNYHMAKRHPDVKY